MEENDRMIENYAVQKSIQIGGKEIFLAEDMAAEFPYMVCTCAWENPLNIEEYHNAVASDDYLEILSEFLSRVNEQIEHVRAERNERGVTAPPFTADDCVKGGMEQDLDGQLIVIRPETLTAEYRTPDHQLALCTGGNGSRPGARGSAVFNVNIYSGKHSRWERRDVLGVIRPDCISEWAVEKIAELRRGRVRSSVRQKLVENKAAAEKHVSRKKADRIATQGRE